MTPSVEIITLYHGTDVESALDILNNGLNVDRLLALQAGHPIQSDSGWYTAFDPEVAWFFASLAPGDTSRGYTLIEIQLLRAELERLMTVGLARRESIANVPFIAEQIWFDLTAFDILNEQAEFRPYQEK